MNANDVAHAATSPPAVSRHGGWIIPPLSRRSLIQLDGCHSSGYWLCHDRFPIVTIQWPYMWQGIQL